MRGVENSRVGVLRYPYIVLLTTRLTFFLRPHRDYYDGPITTQQIYKTAKCASDAAEAGPHSVASQALSKRAPIRFVFDAPELTAHAVSLCTRRAYKKSLIFICVVAFVLLITLASVLTSPPPDQQRTCAPPSSSPGAQQRAYKGDARRVVMISMDGFRHDYIDRPEINAPNLRRLAAEGTRAQRLQPVFPSKTFPNHYSLATGLFPAWHGIVSNAFTFANASFNMQSLDPRWWLGEPIWQTAALQGRSTGVVFWPGSGVNRTGWECRAPRCLQYNASMPNAERVSHGLALLGGPSPVDLLLLYFSDADDAGHRVGEDAPQITAAVEAVDRAVGAVLAGLERLGLLEETHVVALGDHGMAALCGNKRIDLEELLMRNAGRLLDGVALPQLLPGIELGPLLGIWAGPLNASDSPERRQRAERLALGLNASAQAGGYGDALRVFTKWALPARLGGLGRSERVWDVVGLVAPGYIVGTRDLLQKCVAAYGLSGCTCGGSHGYDPQYAAMGSLFVGRGPRFPAGSVLPGWTPATEVYALLADLLGLRPAPNNGTLGFPARVLTPARR